MHNKQCIMCGQVTANENRVCDKCNNTFAESFEENINNKTKRNDSKDNKTNRKV